MSVIIFNSDEPGVYIVRCYNQAPSVPEVHKISGDIETWTGDTHSTEADAYLQAYVWLRKKQADELHELECIMARKGIEGFPSNNNVFLKFFPNLHKEQQKERIEQLKLGIKERKK